MAESLFVPPLLAMTAVLGFLVAIFASHCFFVIVETTAAGNRSIRWPDEPFIDWFSRVFYLAYLLGLWFVPSYFIGRAVAGGTGGLILAGIVMIVVFPIGLLSAMTSVSRFQPLSATMILRAMQKPGQVIAFYLLSTPVAIAALLGIAGVLGKLNETSLLASAGGGAALAVVAMLYGRLVGRLAFLLTFTRDPYPVVDVAEKDRPKRRARSEARVQPSDAVVSDPWKVPPPASEPDASDLPLIGPEGEVTGYGLSASSSPPPPMEVPLAILAAQIDDDDDSIQVEGDDEERVVMNKKLSLAERKNQRKRMKPIRRKQYDENTASVDEHAFEKERRLHEVDRPIEPTTAWDAGLLLGLLEPSPLMRIMVLMIGTGVIGLLLVAARILLQPASE